MLAYSVSSVALTAPVAVLAQFEAPGNTGLPDSGGGGVFGIVSNIMSWLLRIVGVVGVIGFAIAGILYLTAAGDEGRIETAKKAMLYSIIGVVVALAGLVALNFAKGMLGAESTF